MADCFKFADRQRQSFCLRSWCRLANVQEDQLKPSGNIWEMTLKRDGSSVAGGMWTTTQQTWHLKAGRFRYNQEGTVDDSWQPDGRHDTRRLVSAEQRDRRPGWSATWLSGPRYCGASPCKTLYVRTAILNWSRSGAVQTKASSTPATIVASVDEA